ncbi:acetyl-coenzyme A synthetase N-terminal domain-containing protein [Stenotrophomonas maltophilia]
MNYEETYRRSIDEPEAFWGAEAKRIHWHKPPQQVLDYSNPPFRRWFVGGETNLCYNAVDRHGRARRPARTGRHLHRNQQHTRDHLSPAVPRSERLRRGTQAPRRRPR